MFFFRPPTESRRGYLLAVHLPSHRSSFERVRRREHFCQFTELWRTEQKAIEVVWDDAESWEGGLVVMWDEGPWHSNSQTNNF
jgi:hypothetical protein